MLSIILVGILDYYIIQLTYYWYHRFIHSPKSGLFYKYHYLGHHKTEFPISNLRKKTYNTNGSSGWFSTGGELVFGVPLTILLALIYNSIQLHNFMIFSSVLMAQLCVGEFVHSSYHLDSDAISHPESLYIHKLLCKTSKFYRLQYLHDLHHSYKKANFGFFDMTMDKIFGTYSEEMPHYLEHHRELHTDYVRSLQVNYV